MWPIQKLFYKKNDTEVYTAVYTIYPLSLRWYGNINFRPYHPALIHSHLLCSNLLQYVFVVVLLCVFPLEDFRLVPVHIYMYKCQWDSTPQWIYSFMCGVHIFMTLWSQVHQKEKYVLHILCLLLTLFKLIVLSSLESHESNTFPVSYKIYTFFFIVIFYLTHQVSSALKLTYYSYCNCLIARPAASKIKHFHGFYFNCIF